jgi:hypothetical protein
MFREIIRRPVPDSCACALIFLKQSSGIFDADPNPGTGLPLVAIAQEDVAFPARHRGKIRPCQSKGEAEYSRVVVETFRKILYPEDRIHSLEGNSRAGFGNFVDDMFVDLGCRRLGAECLEILLRPLLDAVESLPQVL